MLFVGHLLKFKLTYRVSKQEPMGMRVHGYELNSNRACPRLPQGRRVAGFEFHSYSPAHDPIGSQPLDLYANFNFEIQTRSSSNGSSRINRTNRHMVRRGFASRLVKWNRCHQGFHKFERTNTGCGETGFVNLYTCMSSIQRKHTKIFTKYPPKLYR